MKPATPNDTEIKPLITFSKEDLKLVNDMLTLDGVAEIDRQRFIRVCERTGLDPITRQIYGRGQRSNKRIKRGNEWVDNWVVELVIITGIDGLRALAERTHQYRGQTPPEWLWVDKQVGGDLAWHDYFASPLDGQGNSIVLPDAARVGVLREGFAQPCFGFARFSSFAQYITEKTGQGQNEKKQRVLNQFWKRMPEHQIAKCAEAHAFRKAFPQVFGDIYIPEEIQPHDEEDAPLAQAGPAVEQPRDETIHIQPGEKIPSKIDLAKAASKPVEKVAEKPAGKPPEVNPEDAPEFPFPETTPETEPPVEPAPPAPKTSARAERREAAKAPAAPKSAAKTPEPDFLATDREEKMAQRTTTSGVTAEEQGWYEHTLDAVVSQRFKGRTIGDLTFDELTDLKENWAERHYDKIVAGKAENPRKLANADAVLEAYQWYESQQ